MVDNPASFPVLASALPPDSKSVLTFLQALLGPILIRGNERRFLVCANSRFTGTSPTIPCQSSSKVKAGTCRETFALGHGRIAMAPISAQSARLRTGVEPLTPVEMLPPVLTFCEHHSRYPPFSRAGFSLKACALGERAMPPGIGCATPRAFTHRARLLTQRRSRSWRGAGKPGELLRQGRCLNTQ
jgi:hypothetical protein